MGERDRCDEVWDYIFRGLDGRESLSVWRGNMQTFVDDYRIRSNRADKKQNLIIGGIITIFGAVLLHYIFHIG